MVRLVIILAVFAVACCSAGPQGYNYNHRQIQNTQNYSPQQETVLTKSFYFFSAPDDEPKSTQINRITSNVNNHQQVGFINAPEYNAYTNAAINLARQAAKAKTQIYLLTKEPDLADLEKRFQEILSSSVQKPDVHFVKYRTNEEALAAQKAIRAQYENLPGTSNSLNGAAALLDYSKSGTTNDDDDDDLYTARRPPFLPTGVDVVPGSSYLPPWRGQALR